MDVTSQTSDEDSRPTDFLSNLHHQGGRRCQTSDEDSRPTDKSVSWLLLGAIIRLRPLTRIHAPPTFFKFRTVVI